MELSKQTAGTWSGRFGEGILPGSEEVSAGRKRLLERMLFHSGFRLRFPRRLEAEYQDAIRDATYRQAMVAILLGAIGTVPLVLADYFLMPQRFPKLLEIHLYYFSAMALVIAAILSPWGRERLSLSISFLGWLVMASFFHLAAYSTPPYDRNYASAVVAVVLWMFLMNRIDIRWGLLNAGVLLLMNVAYLTFVPDPGPDVFIRHYSVVAYLVIALIASYLLERERRKSYLQERLLQLGVDELAATASELEEQANLDSLTRVLNRRGLDRALVEQWSRHLTTEEPLAAIMLDIDHFKAFNDRYGHQAGDRCLEAVATAIRENLRSGDLSGRYGGEEFLVLLPRVSQEVALARAHTIADAVRKLAIAHAASPAKVVTVSAGVGTIVPSHPEALPDFLSEVDDALYEAKDQGRDRVVSVETLGQRPLPLVHPVQSRSRR